MPEIEHTDVPTSPLRPRWTTLVAWCLCAGSWAICLGLAFYFLHEDWTSTAIGLVVLLVVAAIGWRLDRRIDLAALFKRH